MREKRADKILELSGAKEILERNLKAGLGYDESLQFYDENENLYDLSPEADKAVHEFFDMCESGENPVVAFSKVFNK